jgi:type IV pilus assembly protein PilQ
VKDFLSMSGTLAATTMLVATVLPAIAAEVTQVTGVQLTPADSGMNIVLQTQAGSKPPQVFNTNRGNTWNAYVFNTKLANNQPFRQNNPAPGIASISVIPTGKDGVQVTVVSDSNAAPTGQLISKDGKGVVLNVVGKAGAPGRLAQAVTMPPGEAIAQNTQSSAPIAQASPTPIAPFIPSPTAPRTAPQAPNTIAPPLMPRASAPPVGDMAISQLDTTSSFIDLGTNERIPRLVLRDAPVREVLSLLARAAGMNLAFSEGAAAPGGAPGAPGASTGGPTISLDIENESVQDVFNYVLRIACVPAGAQGGGGGASPACASMEANRVGRTIFVGSSLPDDARNVISRTIRLNQTTTEAASNFLTTQGAETQLPITQVSVQTVGEGAAARTIETRTPTILALRASGGVGPLLLRGLSVSADARTNAITLTGHPRKIALATGFLTQLDVRKRQASVQVKVIDIDLNGVDRANTSLGFNFDGIGASITGGEAVATFGSGGQTNFPTGFNWLAQITAAIENQNAKVLTDPTLIIQEGQSAGVRVVEEVVTNFKSTTTTTGNTSNTTVEVEKQDAGLILNIDLRRIDDNGFISMEISSKISAPRNQQAVGVAGVGANNFITLLQKRDTSSGLLRIRDGQTLILTGVIQETDRASVTKVPILGDLPILGALFRNTSRTKERREVIVMVTPKTLDDTDRSAFGYGYNPGKEAQQFLQQNR